MNLKPITVFFVTAILAICFGFSTAWAGDRSHRRGNDNGIKNGHHQRDRQMKSRPGKFQDRITTLRQTRQAGRIKHGVRSGQITRPEAKRLRTQQRRINRAYHRMTADGRYDRYERRRMQQMQYRASQHIYRAKHNPARRHHYHHHPYDYRYRKHRHHPEWSRFSAGVWDSGWRFAFSFGGR